MASVSELAAFVDTVTLSSTNAIMGVIQQRKAYQQGETVSLSFLNNNQWYRTLTTEEKRKFRRLAMLYITG